MGKMCCLAVSGLVKIKGDTGQDQVTAEHLVMEVMQEARTDRILHH
jgi:hypothetical protein